MKKPILLLNMQPFCRIVTKNVEKCRPTASFGTMADLRKYHHHHEEGALMFKSYRFRIYPSPSQQAQLETYFGCSRHVYNHLVEKQADHSLVSRNLQTTLIRQMSEDQPWLHSINPSIVFHAFDNFNHNLQHSQALNRRLKFKNSYSRQSFCLTNYKNSAQISPRSVQIQPMGSLKARISQWPLGQVLNITIIRMASGRYYMSVLTRQPDVACQPMALKEKIRCIGLDMGIRHFLTMSDGTQIENPRYFEEDLERLRHLQKGLVRKVKGSSNYHKQCRRITRYHERIASQRNAFLHKLSTHIVREYDIISVEKLGITDMLEERQLSLKISDASWRKFINMLAYKANWYGKQLIQIDRYYPSSKTCCRCHYKLAELPLYIRDWQCPQCETQHDRDTNAAINIMIEGVKIYIKNNPAHKKKLIPVLSDRR